MGPVIGKLLRSTLLWCCLLSNFPQFVILENLSILGLALSEAKGITLYIKNDSDVVSEFLTYSQISSCHFMLRQDISCLEVLS